MPQFIFMGDIKHPGRIIVEADSKEEAIERFEEHEFEVYDESDKCLAFEWNGEEPEINEHS